jgi:ribulose-phosphate 3-epimerase
MSVNPGFGGQSFIESTYEKIKKLSDIIKKAEASTQIEIDGGVTNQNAKKLIECGANALVAGSFVFSSKNPIETISSLKNIH